MKGMPLWSDKVWTHQDLQLTALPLRFTWHHAAASDRRKTKYWKGQWVHPALCRNDPSSRFLWFPHWPTRAEPGSTGFARLTREVCSQSLGGGRRLRPVNSINSEFKFTVEQCKCVSEETICTVCFLFPFFPSLSLLSACLPSSCMEGAGKLLTDRQTDRLIGRQTGRLSRWLEHYWVPINPWLSLQLGVTCTHWPNHGATPKPIWPGDSHRWQFVGRQAARVSRHTDDTHQGTLHYVCRWVCVFAKK